MIGWITGIYPIRQDAQDALDRGDLYVCELDGRVAASGIINQRQSTSMRTGTGCIRPKTARSWSCTR